MVSKQTFWARKCPFLEPLFKSLKSLCSSKKVNNLTAIRRKNLSHSRAIDQTASVTQYNSQQNQRNTLVGISNLTWVSTYLYRFSLLLKFQFHFSTTEGITKVRSCYKGFWNGFIWHHLILITLKQYQHSFCRDAEICSIAVYSLPGEKVISLTNLSTGSAEQWFCALKASGTH